MTSLLGKPPYFETPLDCEEINHEDNLWKLLSLLRYNSPIFGGVIEVPQFFVTDFASVPRIPLAYLLCGNTAHEAAVVHDYLYQTHGRDRATCDKILLEAMLTTQVPKWRAYMMYWAVRLGGYSAYKSGPSRFQVLNK